MPTMEAWAWPPVYDDTYQPEPTDEYWFPNRETLNPDERDAHIALRIREVMEYAYAESPFYRRKWSEAGIHPNDVQSLEDFEHVPPVTKDEIRVDQSENPPFGDYLCIPIDDVQRVHGTSGTTGRPTAFGIGRRDWRSIGNAHARVMWAMGIRPSDTIFIAAFFSLYMGSWATLLGAERLGATVFPFGAGVPGQTLRAVRWMKQMQPTVFYSTPSYSLHLAETALDDGIAPNSLGLRRMFFSGEPGASIPPIRGRIESHFEAEVFDSGSMAEVTPWVNLAETTGHAGMLCWQDLVYTEVVDPGTHRRVPYGQEGTPLYTTLERTSQPMIRLRSNDLTRWEGPSSACGRTYPVLPRGIYGRIDDMFTIRGENVYPSAIDEIVMAQTDYGGEHRIVISRDHTMDQLIVQVEGKEELFGEGDSAVERWRRDVEQKIAAALGVGAKVGVTRPGVFERTQMKANRVIDNRDLWRSLSSSSDDE